MENYNVKFQMQKMWIRSNFSFLIVFFIFEIYILNYVERSKTLRKITQ